MGIAAIRKRAGDMTARGMTPRPAPEPLTCRSCGLPVAGRGESAICGRCAEIEKRIAETGSPNKRRINQPSRHARRAKARKGSKG